MNDALEYAELVKPQKKEGMKEKREKRYTGSCGFRRVVLY
jgi:hypothetical protein